MKCLRCGYCCRRSAVVVVDDPSKPLDENNVVYYHGDGTPCKHLQGEEPGKFSCAIHHYDWYEDTPCFQHTQIEHGDEPCRMGEYILKRFKETGKYL